MPAPRRNMSTLRNAPTPSTPTNDIIETKTPSAPRKKKLEKSDTEFASMILDFKRDHVVVQERSIDTEWNYDDPSEAIEKALEGNKSPVYIPFKINNEPVNVTIQAKVNVATANYGDTFGPVFYFDTYVVDDANFTALCIEMMETFDQHELEVNEQTLKMKNELILGIKLKVNDRYSLLFPKDLIGSNNRETTTNFLMKVNANDGMCTFKLRFGIFIDLVKRKIGVYNSVQQVIV